jgi:hypothetical protein
MKSFKEYTEFTFFKNETKIDLIATDLVCRGIFVL